jgi:carbon monoxide dehydrogenase subunit G
VPAGAASCVIALDVPGVWAFLRDYANWASLFPGYQRHALVGPGVSRWTVKGDVGMFVRTVDLEVRIAEETARRRVRFTVEGVTENVTGEGLFELTAVEPGHSRLSLTLDVRAGGPMGPVINVLLGSRLGGLLEAFAAALSGRLTPGAASETPS